MELKILRIRQQQGTWRDDLLRYIDEYLQVIGKETTEDFIYDLPSLYKFLSDRMGEFTRANSRIYKKPVGFHLVLSQPSCCPHHIRIGDSMECIKIFKKTP